MMSLDLGGMKQSKSTYIHPFAMSLSAHLGSLNKNGIS
jgi:hypothetical protein